LGWTTFFTPTTPNLVKTMVKAHIFDEILERLSHLLDLTVHAVVGQSVNPIFVVPGVPDIFWIPEASSAANRGREADPPGNRIRSAASVCFNATSIFSSVGRTSSQPSLETSRW
jgi:hypothetical protein